MKSRTTQRGFSISEFVDLYGSECSLQESSLATDNAIWLGVDRPFTDDPTAGHVGRMHLNREMVKALLPALRYFAKHGVLPTEKDND